MIITKDYINRHKTPKGAWNKKQINALGLEWPPTNGWINRLVGDELSTVSARIFEESKVSNKKPDNKMSVDNCITYLIKNAHKLDAKQVVEIRAIEKAYLESREV